jgi:hypothetical protein
MQVGLASRLVQVRRGVAQIEMLLLLLVGVALLRVGRVVAAASLLLLMVNDGLRHLFERGQACFHFERLSSEPARAKELTVTDQIVGSRARQVFSNDHAHQLHLGSVGSHRV